MAKKIIKAQMKQRLDTKANWAAQNPVLLAGELGIVSDDPNLYKVGDGATAWNALPFRGFDGTLAQETGTSENAAMSQKAVTEELAKLSEETDTKLAEVESDVNRMSFRVIGETDLTNGYVKNDGEIISSGVWKTTGWIFLSSILNIRGGLNLSLTTDSSEDYGIYPISFRNADGIVTTLSAQKASYSYSDIPSDAVEVAFNFFKPSSESLKINSLDESLIGLENSTIDNANNISNLSNSVKNKLFGNYELFGLYVKNDGTTAEHVSWKSTGWIKVENIFDIKTGVRLSILPDFSVDSNIYPILFKNGDGGVSFLELTSLEYAYSDIPSDAVEVAFNFFKPSSESLKINSLDEWVERTAARIENNALGIENNALGIENNAARIQNLANEHYFYSVNTLQPLLQTSERYLSADGKLANAGAGNTTYVVNEYSVKSGARYVICGSAYYASSVIFAFYDSENSLVSVGGTGDTNGWRSIINEEVIAPKNATLLRVAFLNNFRGYNASVVEFAVGEANMLDVLRGGLVKESIDLTNASYVKRYIYVDETSNKWNSDTGRNCIILPLDGVLAIELIGKTESTQYTMLSESANNRTEVGSIPNYADGYVNVHTLALGEKRILPVPQNARFLYILRENNGSILLPDVGFYKLKQSVRRPIFSMSDDDTVDSALQWVEKVVDATGVPYTCALIKSNITDWAEVRRLRNKGVTFLPHGITALTEMTEEEMEIHFKDMQAIFEQHGLNADFYVYPQGRHNDTTLPVVKKYFKGAFNAEVSLTGSYPYNPIMVNIPPIDTFNIARISIEDATVEMMKAAVDKAIADKGWCIFMTHAYWEAYTEERMNELIEVIRYACERGGEFLSLPDAFKVFKNRFESSEKVVGCDGITYTL